MEEISGAFQLELRVYPERAEPLDTGCCSGPQRKPMSCQWELPHSLAGRIKNRVSQSGPDSRARLLTNPG